ncbi:MAG TPA: C45 family peptidase [Planctomycetota bacterium]|nr:C45 family peptidase [Planctomycetota bacterium]
MSRGIRFVVGVLALVGSSCSSISSKPPHSDDPRLASASRRDEAGWIVLHLEGSPSTIGFQYGWLAADEIADALAMFQSYVPTACKRDWRFFRRTTEELYWPKLDDEQRAEIDGIVEGVRARGKSIDREDVVAINGWMEIGWYDIPAIDGRDNAAPGNCSAFIATGSWTADGGIVMAHNAWVDYVVGERWNLVLDIVPEHGHRMFMDSFPGFIDSGDDFALNDAGLMVTETTITQFKGFDPAGVPEFARARRAIQYADSIDEWARIMREGNNGAYANSWLVGDRKTGEIARLELGLKNTPMERTKDGYFVGSNFPSDAKLREEETTFDAKDEHNSANVRRKRWETLMGENRGRIDVEAGKRFLADHVDARDGAAVPSAHTLCGHVDLDNEGAPEWAWAASYPGGACQSKVVDSKLASELSFWTCMGHACGETFRAKKFLATHPEFEWQEPFLHDLPSREWTRFSSSQSDAYCRIPNPSR